MKIVSVVSIFIFLLATSCTSNESDRSATTDADSTVVAPQTSQEVPKEKREATAEMILAKQEVPVLCYHHIREAKPGQSETLKNYSVSPAQFAQQMKALKDSGYETILPDQLYNFLVYDASLPAKPVMITMDDTDEEQYSIGWQEMKKHGFKGVFFVMTVSINRSRYMTKDQLKELADDGNVIESHTWDHHMVTKYKDEDWETQLVKPTKTIEGITGVGVKYFAYPFGLWNQAAIGQLKNHGFKMAFILSTKRDSVDPLFTVRRMLVPGQWSTNGVLKSMKQTFRLKDE